MTSRTARPWRQTQRDRKTRAIAGPEHNPNHFATTSTLTPLKPSPVFVCAMLVILFKQVERGMKAADARKLCPELSLVQVPTRNGKADISLYR